MKPQGFYINLDRVPDRARHMDRELQAAGLGGVSRFSACDARAGLDATGYSPESWGEYWSLKPSEVACFESHRMLWEHVAAADEALAIFEDDILIAPGLGDAIAALAREQAAFDLIKLDGGPGVVRLGPPTPLAGYSVRPILQALPSSAAYLLSPSGAASLLKSSERYCDHLDDFISRPRQGWRAFQLDPALALQGMFADKGAAARVPGAVAESERTTDAAINAGYDKGPATYRLRKELRRGARKVARKFWLDRNLVSAGGHLGEIPLAGDVGPYRKD